MYGSRIRVENMATPCKKNATEPFLHFVHATFQAFSNILMYHSRLDLIGFGICR